MLNLDIVRTRVAGEWPKDRLDVTILIYGGTQKNYNKTFVDDIVDFGFKYNHLIDGYLFKVDGVEDFNGVMDLLSGYDYTFELKVRI